MTIGFDIDNTMTNSKESAKYFYNKYVKNNCQRTDLYFSTFKEKKKFFDKYLLDIMNNATIKDDVHKVFEYLKSKHHRIILITRRGFNESNKIEQLTIDYLKKNNIYYDKLYQKIDNKGLIASKENVEIFFDDHLFNLDSINSKGIKAVQFGDKTGSYDNVKNWNELLNYIKGKGF